MYSDTRTKPEFIHTTNMIRSNEYLAKEIEKQKPLLPLYDEYSTNLENLVLSASSIRIQIKKIEKSLKNTENFYGVSSICRTTENTSPIKLVQSFLFEPEKIMLKYTGSLDNEVAKFLMDGVKSGFSVLLEITPKYYATWDHSTGFTS